MYPSTPCASRGTFGPHLGPDPHPLDPSAAWTPSLALVLVPCIHDGLSHVTIHLLTCLHDCVLLDSITTLLVPHGKRSGFKHTLFLPGPESLVHLIHGESF
jgi:hypothetical protein